jgi:cold shock protein
LQFTAPSERVGTTANRPRHPEEEAAFRDSPKKAPGVSFSVGVREGRDAEAHMARGTVKWFSEDKGYGFITPDEGDEDLFVHYTGIEGTGFRSLKEGDRVSYEPTRGRKGEEAKNVRKVA